MKRARIGKRYPHTIVLNYNMDAIKWCQQHHSQGRFSIEFGLDDQLVIKFGFTDIEDFTLFSLTWG